MNRNFLKSELATLSNDELYVLLKDMFDYGSSRIWDFEEVIMNIDVENYKGESQC